MDNSEMLNKALEITTILKYKVIINNELKEMNYMELGLFLTTKSNEIDIIKITTKDWIIMRKYWYKVLLYITITIGIGLIIKYVLGISFTLRF